MKKMIIALAMVFGLAVSAFTKEVAIVNRTGGTIIVYEQDENARVKGNFYEVVNDESFTVIDVPDERNFAVGFFFDTKTGRWSGFWSGLNNTKSLVEFHWDKKKKAPTSRSFDRTSVVAMPE